jgi:uncharacterized protein (DUF2249 family)
MTMIDTFGRKLMNGDVIEIPNLRDYHPLNKEIPSALPRYYQIQDADFASEGFSVTWLPHLWRVKCTPLKDQQEFSNITRQAVCGRKHLGSRQLLSLQVPLSI